jgi:hypothetical protein
MATLKRFSIRTYGNDFFAGRCANGDQALLGLLCPNVVLYRFDRHGNQIDREVRPWLHPAEQRKGIYAIYERTFRERLAKQIANWRTELGFVEARIEIAEFFDVEQGVGIELPENDECACVLWWAKDYWMDDQGGVKST